MGSHRTWGTVFVGAALLIANSGYCGNALADEASLRSVVDAYVAAFNKQDPAAIGALWTEGGVHRDLDTGERTEGREAIQKDLVTVFRERPTAKLSAQIQRARMITDDVGRVEGETTVVVGAEEPSISSFTALIVRRGDKWLVDSIEEVAAPTPAGSYEALKQLEWLVGKWVDQSDSGRVETVFRWTPNQAFLLRSFTVTGAEGETQQRGTQVIGWDPRARNIRSWSFNSDGSFGDAVWSANGEQWLIKSAQVLPDGRAAAGTYVLTRVDKDAMTLQLIGHELDGEPQPAGEPVKVVRVAEPAATAPTTTSTPTTEPRGASR
ncbi:MAG: SgcJ/EcaC family oxidoreductase [Planctomycetales bacterium]|nr:SgcJ/EcaC family oxidoreductase [Planctomycetales bacterium]